jgi:hypothetical protein
VTVRKLTALKYESFTAGKRVRLSHLFGRAVSKG